MKHHIEITPAEITEHFARCMAGESASKTQRAVKDYGYEFRTGARRDFYGCTGTEMKDWLEHGFYTDKPAPEIAYGEAERPRRRLRFDEEGELQIDLALSGHDYPFLEWERRPSKRGLKVRANITFSAGTNSRRIGEYLEYVLTVIESAEMNGYSPEVELVIDLKEGQTFTDPAHKRDGLLITIPVKDSLHANDRVTWRAFFSVAGFRMLGFLSMINAADRLGAQLPSSMGMPQQSGSWRIAYDADTATLDICPPRMPRDFPADRLREEVSKAGIHS